MVAAVQVKSSPSLPMPLSWSDSVAGSVPLCDTPISVLTSPLAAPPTAVKLPSYDRNCTTAPPASTSASPSGAPFWMPGVAKLSVPLPSSWLGITPDSAIVE